MVARCSAFGCKETFVKGGAITFHSFPKNDERRKAWEIQLRRKNFKATKNSKICSKHFAEDCFNKSKFGGTWLKTDAMPTIFNWPTIFTFPDHLQETVKRRNPVKRQAVFTENDAIDCYSEETKCMSPCAVNLMNDIGRLFNNKEHSDYTLKCGESKFYVHKAVLAARSGYFAAMFRADLKETSVGVGNIENIEPDVLELVLRYLYIGEIPVLSKTSLQKVYTAADRLLIEPLEVKCRLLSIDCLTHNINEGSVKKMKSEQSASIEQSETIKEELHDAEGHQILRNLFICSEWKLFEQKFPSRACEMYRIFLKKL